VAKAKARNGLRLNEHIEHDDGEVVFRHVCKLGARGHRVEAQGVAVSQWSFARLAQNEKPKCGLGGPPTS
jgi:hypothetical protein